MLLSENLYRLFRPNYSHLNVITYIYFIVVACSFVSILDIQKTAITGFERGTRKLFSSECCLWLPLTYSLLAMCAYEFSFECGL